MAGNSRIPPLLPSPLSSAMPPSQAPHHGGNESHMHQRHIQPLMQPNPSTFTQQTRPQEHTQYPPRPLMDPPQALMDPPRPLMDSPRPLMDPPRPLMDSPNHQSPLISTYSMPHQYSRNTTFQQGALLPRPPLYNDPPQSYVPPHRRSYRPPNVSPHSYPYQRPNRGRGRYFQGRDRGPKRKDRPFDHNGGSSSNGSIELYYKDSMLEDPWAELVHRTGVRIDVWGKTQSKSPEPSNVHPSEDLATDKPSQTENDSNEPGSGDQEETTMSVDSTEKTDAMICSGNQEETTVNVASAEKTGSGNQEETTVNVASAEKTGSGNQEETTVNVASTEKTGSGNREETTVSVDSTEKTGSI